jgi:hypothetical protein
MCNMFVPGESSAGEVRTRRFEIWDSDSPSTVVIGPQRPNMPSGYG